MVGDAPAHRVAAAARVEMSARTFVSNESGVESGLLTTDEGSLGFWKLDWMAEDVAGLASNTKCPLVDVLEAMLLGFCVFETAAASASASGRVC
jgi:hypothetical protein